MVPRGLERVTVAPGSTAPDASETVPPIAPTPCAAAGSVENIQNDNTTMLLPTRPLALIVTPLFDVARQGFQCDGSDDREHTPPAIAEGAAGDVSTVAKCSISNYRDVFS